MKFNSTKNLFDYATKELSQDAFLRWLFENWNSEENDVRIASRKLLEVLVKTKIDFDNISSFEARTQEKSIDILVDIKIKDENFIIVVEDKTFSGTHDEQLERYKEYVDEEYSTANITYVYYKTSLVTKDEEEHVKNCGWEVYIIKDIDKIFNSFKDTAVNDILKDYCSYIFNLNDELNGELPLEIEQWNMNNWLNFCINHDLNVPDNIDVGFGNYRNQYVYIVFYLKDKWNKNPYAEIRSRDFSNNKFILKILLYGTKQEFLDKYLDIWKSDFGKSRLFKLQNYKQQIAINSNHEEVFTLDDLKNLLKKYIDEYLKIML